MGRPIFDTLLNACGSLAVAFNLGAAFPNKPTLAWVGFLAMFCILQRLTEMTQEQRLHHTQTIVEQQWRQRL